MPGWLQRFVGIGRNEGVPSSNLGVGSNRRQFIDADAAASWPNVETSELVHGLYIVDLPDLATPSRSRGLLDSPTIEVRPVLDMSSDAAGVG